MQGENEMADRMIQGKLHMRPMLVKKTHMRPMLVKKNLFFNALLSHFLARFGGMFFLRLYCFQLAEAARGWKQKESKPREAT